MRRIPATVITGFLGAGKTSLVRHLLAHAAGHRLAVLVNEFGELGIDRELLLGCRRFPAGPDAAPRPRRTARAHSDRDLRSRLAETARPGLRLARDPHQD